MEKEVKRGCGAMLQALEAVAKRAGSTEIPASQVLTFLCVAFRGEVPIADLATETGVVLSSASRNVAKLGPGPNPKDPGLGLLKAQEDPWNRKRKLISLTAHGQELAAAIERVFARSFK
jgi:DNA-binding MarR family transcriptional regulator